MRKLIASAIVALLAITAVQTQAQTTARAIEKESKVEKREARKELRKLEGKEVSSNSKDHFNNDFGNVNDVKWTRGTQFDEADFTKDGQQTIAYYDYNSQLVGSTTSKKFSDLPASAQKEIKKEYKDYVAGAVIMFDDNQENDTNMVLFSHQFDDEDHYFVTISKGKKEIVLMVTMTGEVSYFKQVS